MDIDELRDHVRAELQDTGVDAAELLSDNELDQALERATARYSHTRRRERATATTIPATGTLRELDISTLSPRFDIVAVEYPTGDFPKSWSPFSIWAQTLTLDLENEPTASAAVNILWTSPHTPASVDGADQDIVLTGALAFALSMLMNQKRNTLNVAGPDVWGRIASAQQDAQQRFQAQLRRLRTVRRSSMNASDAHQRTQSQTTDSGPV